MILILSERSEPSTTFVIEWLEYFNKKWIRINIEDPIDLDFIGDDVVFKLDEKEYKLSEFSSYWYRRGMFSFINKYNTGVEQFDDFLKIEYGKIIEFIYFRLRKLKSINCIEFCNVNKLIVNTIAKDIGILTPKDLIFSSKDAIIRYKLEEPFLTKPIGGGAINIFESFSTYNYSTLLETKKIKNINFFPSLIQNYVHKKYELRIFYFHGEFFSMAIMSQLDKQTAIDFRKYNVERPNRTVPFNLPYDVKEKLNTLMMKLNLNCGSIDMIVTPENEYVFLEVNPVGQFGMTSYPCNFQLERKIAEFF
jgi:ATP-GRASP peptide maturase of grasp-with-spasm system